MLEKCFMLSLVMNQFAHFISVISMLPLQLQSILSAPWGSSLLPGVQRVRVAADSEGFGVGADGVERSGGMEGHGTHCLRVLQLVHFDKLCFGGFPRLHRIRNISFWTMTYMQHQHIHFLPFRKKVKLMCRYFIGFILRFAKVTKKDRRYNISILILKYIWK